MLVIRLARTGRTKYPTYRIVAADSSRAATGRFVAALGHYNPHTKELVVKREETEKYLSNGAQPSNSVIKLLTREGVELPKWAKLKTKAPKKVEEVEVETPAAEAEPVADETAPEETPVSEAPAEETPAADEVRVGTVAEEVAADNADTTSSLETQETDAGEEAQAEAAVEAQTAADASAEEAATKDESADA